VVATLWPYIVSSNKKAETTTTTSSTDPPIYQIPQIIVQVPPTPPTLQRSPVSPPTQAAYRGIVGIPPPTDPKTIQQREKAVKEVYDKLTQPDITAIALTGIGGVGKSTLAALVYRYAEARQRAGNSPFAMPPIWTRIDLSVTMTDILGNLSDALKVPITDVSTLSPQNQAIALFKALNSVDQPHLIVLDQFENVLEDDGHAKSDRPGIGEWLDALNSERCTCRVLLTSRPDPQGTRDYPTTYLQLCHVDGLSEVEGIELLQKWKVNATEADMRTAIKRCKGHTLSLTLLVSLLQKRNLSLSTLLNDQQYMQLWTGDIAKKLLNAIYNEQLDTLERKLLQGFSVYREPVRLDAALAIIDTSTQIPRVQFESTLDGLLALHLLQASGEGRYQLHIIVATYVQDHFVEGNELANRQALQVGHTRAARYYQQLAATSCPPREKRKQINDVHDLVEAIWQHSQAGQWQEAYDLMEQESIFNELNRWGGNAILLELYQLLLTDKWHPERSEAADLYNRLGWIYYDLGKMKAALKYYEEALTKWKEVGDRGREGFILNNLALVFNSLGQNEKAIEYYEQALSIQREVGNRLEEGRALNNLAGAYDALGQKQEAFHYYNQALQISQEVGDRAGEGTTLWNIGALYFKRNRYNVALACFLIARGIFEEVQNPNREKVQNSIDDLHEEVGEKWFAELLGQVELQAYQIVEQVLSKGL